MARIRNVVKWGNSTLIMLKPSDPVDMGIEAGDKVDIEDILIIKTKKGGKKK